MPMVKACNAPSYVGGDPFIFIHYFIADESEAFTLMEHLAAWGLRVYYAPAEASVRQTAAEINRQLNTHLSECTALVVLYSPEAAQDHQFRKIITSAVLNGKPILPVFLEDFSLSPGMRAQFEPDTRINWYSMTEDMPSLTHLRVIECAKGEPNPDIRVEQRSPRIRQKAAPLGAEKRRWPVSAILVDEADILRQRGLRQAEPSSRPIPRTVVLEEENEAAPNICTEGAERGRHGTFILEEIPSICVLIPTGERIAGRYGLTRIGRSESCDIQIPEYTVSSQHLEVFSFANADGSFKNTLVDCHSSNGSWVNGRRLAGGESVSVVSHACVSLGRNVHLFLAFGREAQELARKDALYALECVETREIQVLCEEEIVLGRCDPFGNGCFDFPQISWEHARLRCTQRGCTITDQSSNGTCVNGEKIAKYSEVALKDGDVIIMGYHRYVLRRIVLRERKAAWTKAQPPVSVPI